MIELFKKGLPKLYICYCVLGIICSCFGGDERGLSISDFDIIYALINLTVIYCLIKTTKYTWLMLVLFLSITFPIALTFGRTNEPFEWILFTMSPVFNTSIMTYRNIHFKFLFIGIALQSAIIIWLFLKDIRVKYGVSFSEDSKSF